MADPRQLLMALSEEEINHTIVALQEELIMWKTVRALRRVIDCPHRAPQAMQAVVAAVQAQIPTKPANGATVAVRALPADNRGSTSRSLGIGKGNCYANQEKRDAILKVLINNGQPMTTQAIATATGRSYAGAYGFLAKLYERGLIKRTGTKAWYAVTNGDNHDSTPERAEGDQVHVGSASAPSTPIGIDTRHEEPEERSRVPSGHADELGGGFYQTR